jgi:hypothetical protein
MKLYTTSVDKSKDGQWEWSVILWLSEVSTYADCVIKSSDSLTFDTEEEARKNMLEVLKGLDILPLPHMQNGQRSYK